jgi:hypothetical protein
MSRIVHLALKVEDLEKLLLIHFAATVVPVCGTGPRSTPHDKELTIRNWEPI